ncbi:MAG: nitroreductase family protein [Firmicutes bacterium]|nr:nitroreductase family protein [Bacillota bacterium]
MKFLELAKKRCSVRKYEDKPVEQEKLERILEAARVAPTAANRQPHRILVVKTADGLAKLKKAGNVYEAPLAFVICADHATSWKRPIDGKDVADIDATIVTTHMMLEAADLGLDSIWVCFFDPATIKNEFALPEGVEPINILGIGYVAGDVKAPERHEVDRKPLAETVYYETF